MTTRLPLTAFLLKPDILPTTCLTPNFHEVAEFHRWADGSLQAVENPDHATFAGLQPGDLVVALLSRPVGPRPWQTFLAEVFRVPGLISGISRSLGAIAFCAVADPLVSGAELRWIGWAFGSGSGAIRRLATEPRFGLLTALNRIVPEPEDDDPPRGGRGLRQLQYRTFGAFSVRTGHRAAGDTPLAGFRMDQLTDLLSAVGGRTSDTNPEQVFGGRALRSRSRLESATDLGRLAQVAMEDYRSHDYEETFAFINDFVLVEDAILAGRLLERMHQDVIGGHENVDAFLPDDLIDYDDDRAIQFILFPGERVGSASRVTLTVGQLQGKLEGSNVEALNWTLRFCDTAGEVIADATLIECLAADMVLDDERYLLSDGEFFRVNDDFLRRIDGELERVLHTKLKLPCYRGGDEGRWNLETAEPPERGFICLDGELIRLPGESPFEPADLVHASGTLVHTKRKGRSRALGYLFMQARRSCQMYAQVAEACNQLREKVSNASTSASTRRSALQALKRLNNRPPGIEIVLAILGDWRGRTLANLPLLAKVELVDTMRQIEMLGFNPTVALVPLCSVRLTN